MSADLGVEGTGSIRNKMLVSSLWKKLYSQFIGSEHPWDSSLGGGVITAPAAGPMPVTVAGWETREWGAGRGAKYGSAGREGADS